MRNMVNFRRTSFPAGTYITAEELVHNNLIYQALGHASSYRPRHAPVSHVNGGRQVWKHTHTSRGWTRARGHARTTDTPATDRTATAVGPTKIEEVLNSLASLVLPQHSSRWQAEDGEGGVSGEGARGEKQCCKPWWSTCNPLQEDRSWGKVGRRRFLLHQRGHRHRFELKRKQPTFTLEHDTLELLNEFKYTHN